jgi:hypothetical protein
VTTPSLMRAFLIRDPLIRSMRLWRVVGMVILVITARSPLLLAQQTDGSRAASTAVVTFTLDFPQSNPEHYAMAIDAAGHARYECTGKVAENSEEQAYQTEFEVSARNRERVFGLAKQAQYFAGKVDSSNRKVAFTGAKILSYQDGQRSITAKYNYSSLPAVQQLTALFQSMASTLEYGRRLAYYHRYQKLALDEELKHMEEQAKDEQLSEIQGVTPELQAIVEDSSVINVVRARAKEIIEMGTTAAAGH